MIDELLFAVTMGDPAGIGPDITLNAWQCRRAEVMHPFFVIGNVSSYIRRASELGYDPGCIRAISSPEEACGVFPDALPILASSDVPLDVIAGRPNADAASAIIASIEQAVALVFAGQAAGVITNPIAKHVLMARGFRHAGHTEYLGELALRRTGKRVQPVMLMASDRLFAVPLTVHIPLSEVPQAMSIQSIVDTALIIHSDLRRFFGISNPRIAVCGLNPHAGENGKLGSEEIGIITPAIDHLRAKGLRVTGPDPADTLFHEEARFTYDVALAMYHDQALIPFKLLSFHDGVNVTLGLPFIRTSPDHGTAFSLAGSGKASAASFIAALKCAGRMRRHAAAAAQPL